jgi:hypothetical protein
MGIACIRTARLADGTIWQVDEAQLKAAIKKALPTLREYGPLVPETKTEKQPEKGDLISHDAARLISALVARVGSGDR